MIKQVGKNSYHTPESIIAGIGFKINNLDCVID